MGVTLRSYQDATATDAVALLRENGIAYLALATRTGKTITALETAQRYGATRVLFVTKKKALPSIVSDAKLYPSLTVEAVNLESAHKVTGEYDIAIIDEAHGLGAYPKPGTRAKALKDIVRALPIVYLSATPTPESWSQIYHQLWLSDRTPLRAYNSFYKFHRAFGVPKEKHVNGLKIKDYSEVHKDKLDQVIGHLFLSVSQAEAGFDQEAEDELIDVPIDTLELFARLRRHKVIEVNGSTIIAESGAELVQKLHQLVGGTLKDADAETTHMLDRSKAEYIQHHYTGKRLVILYNYIAEGELLREVFGHEIAATPEDFQRGEGRVYIGQTVSTREGVRLDTADLLIFYSLGFSSTSYMQGRNRIVSKEREKKAKVVILCEQGCDLTRKIYQRVINKQNFTSKYYR